LWQPRIDYWYEVNKQRGTLPPQLVGCDQPAVYDYCHASMRYPFNCFGSPSGCAAPLGVRYPGVEIVETRPSADRLKIEYVTPRGTLTQVVHYEEWGLSSALAEYPLKTPDDFAAYEYMLEHEEWYWDADIYQRCLAWVGDRGAPNYFARRSPLQGLFVELMGFEAGVYLMRDHPAVLQRYIEARTAADEAMYAVICAHATPVFNFGENIDAHMDPPPIWRKHVRPYLARRVEQLRSAGIVTSVHVDGSMKRLVGDLRECPTDIIEACTPLPQGDVTLEEMRSALSPNHILMDGIPALYFLPLYPVEDLIACVRDLVRLFYPRLILGISDELPPNADIERVRLVGELVQTLL